MYPFWYIENRCTIFKVHFTKQFGKIEKHPNSVLCYIKGHFLGIASILDCMVHAKILMNIVMFGFKGLAKRITL